MAELQRALERRLDARGAGRLRSLRRYVRFGS